MAVVVAVCYYLLHFPDWVTFRLMPIVITVGFLASVANDIRKMHAAS
jgi:hypothetical protein